MKTKLIIALAAVAMIFTACKKEEIVIDKNQMIYNGVKYDIESSYGTHNSMYGASAFQLTESDDIQPAILFQTEGYIEDIEGLNKTFDLTQADVDVPPLWIYNYEDPSKNLYYGGQSYRFGEDLDNFQEGTPFTSGTLEITKDDDKFTYILKDGVLKNGDTFEVNIYVPKEEFYRK